MENFNLFVLMPVTAVMNMVCSIYLYRLLGLLVEYRKNIKILFLVYGMLLFLLPIYDTDATNVLGMLAAFLFLMLICTRGKLIVRLSSVLIFYPLVLGLNYLACNNPAYMFVTSLKLRAYKGENNFTLQEYLSLLAIWIFLCGLKIAVCAFLHYCFKNRLKEIKGYISERIWLIITIVCTVSFISMVTAIMFPPGDVNLIFGPGNMASALGTFIIVISGMLSIIGILCLLQPLIENVKNRERIQIENLKEEYYRSLEEQQESIRRIHHDMNNHFQAVKGCLDQGDTGGAKEYLEQFTSSLPPGNGIRFCTDRALNAVLNSRFEKLKKLEADVRFNLDIDCIMEITSLEMCTIFSNAIDNAIESVEKIPDPGRRKVTLLARDKKGYFSLQITNSKTNQIQADNGKIMTDKKETGHGYGIGNIREIAERYNGNVEISYTENEFVLFLYMRLE